MNLLRVTAASVLLVGFSAADADTRSNPRQNRELSLPTDVPIAESELEAGWARELRGEGLIWEQASVVFAALRANSGLGDGPAEEPAESNSSEIRLERVVVANNDESPPTIRDGNGSEGCIFMAIPGSRLRERRCYYPSEGEKALNEYQFREEIRYMVEHVEQLELIRQQGEAMMQNYTPMFQR